MKKSILFLFLMCSITLLAQEKVLQGTVVAFGSNLKDINVVNLVNEKSAITNENGQFEISAKVGDLIILSSEFFEYKRRLISEEDWKAGKFSVEMIGKPQQIEEVVITEYKMDAVKAGILSKPAKQYTPAERRLYTATTGSGIIPVSAIINAITGRTAMIKKEIEIEKQEYAQTQLENLFEDSYLIENFKIPEDKIPGFKYYAVEDDSLRSLLKLKNKERVKLQLIQLSEKYLANSQEN